MKKYIHIKLVFGNAILEELHDLMLDEYENICRDVEVFAAERGALALIEDTVNHISGERSFADVDYNFPMNDEEKRALMGLLARFFVDGELGEEGMEIYPILSAVRFLRTEGELFETEA